MNDVFENGINVSVHIGYITSNAEDWLSNVA